MPASHQIEWADIVGFNPETENESVRSVRRFVQDALLSPAPLTYKRQSWWIDTSPVAQSRRAKKRWHGDGLTELEPRNRSIYKLRSLESWSLHRLAREFGLSRWRIRQIVGEYAIFQSDQDILSLQKMPVVHGQSLCSINGAIYQGESFLPSHWKLEAESRWEWFKKRREWRFFRRKFVSSPKIKFLAAT